MSRSQKIIFLTVGVYVAGFVVYLMVNSLWIAPARRISGIMAERQQELHEQEIQIRGRDGLRRRLEAAAARTLGTDETQVRERVRERLMELLGLSGLGPSGLSVDLFDGLDRDAYREVGAGVRATGRLEDVVNFLYLLQSEPVLHRVDALRITPSRRDDAVDLQLRYVTIVPKAREGEPAPTTLATELPEPLIASADRGVYDSIVRRDLFLPYVRRPEPPTVVTRRQPREPAEPPPPAAPAAPAEDSFRVVGLPTMGGSALVHLHDPRGGGVDTYNLGDQLGGMTIVAVDYRRMRWQDEYSTSRVILSSGGDFWAVELGDTIGQRRLLQEHELPLELRRTPTSAPADEDGRAKG